ncbi:hypothetical protein TWF481_008800 [Arthrobotrys musiformis]|uniref:Uncharacterized protein n=1 Tax=Arthrobotrys musiformis TaxID=47236 RepID=A0AAV9W894_9PEZI
MSPTRPNASGNGSSAPPKLPTVPIQDMATTPKKQGAPTALPSTPPGNGYSTARLQTTPGRSYGSPGSPFGSPKPQFTSKSSIPSRWKPSYPEDQPSHPVSQPASQPAAVSVEGGRKAKSTHATKSQEPRAAVQEGSGQDDTDNRRPTPPRASGSSSSGSSSSRERTPPFPIYEEEVGSSAADNSHTSSKSPSASKAPSAPNSPGAPKSSATSQPPGILKSSIVSKSPSTTKSPVTSHPQSRIQTPTASSKKVPAVLRTSQGYGPNNLIHSQESLQGMRKESPKSPQTLRRLLSEAQDREKVDDYLVKMNVIPPTAPAIGVTGKSPRKYAFPTFPVAEGPKNKPYAPDDMVLQSMGDIPLFLEKYKPKEVRALFGNYIASCDDIDDRTCPMRVGQLSIFVPIKMRNGEIITVGLAPAELFHAGWKGTGTPVPIPDRSIIGKRAYAVIVQHPLRSDYVISRAVAVPTGNTQGTVIGIVGGACVLRIEKWFLRGDYFNTDSRLIPVMGDLPDKAKVVLYNSSKAYDEHKADLERKTQDQKDQESHLSVKDLGGTLHQIPKGKILGWDIKVLDFGPVQPPKHLSISLLGGEPEPRDQPETVPRDGIGDGAANDGPDEKATSTLVPSSAQTEVGTMLESGSEGGGPGEVDRGSTDKGEEEGLKAKV